MNPRRNLTHLFFRISVWINGSFFDFEGATEELSEESESESDEGSLLESESLEESESELELELGEDSDDD